MPDTSDESARPRVARRTVLKTGAHAAWVIPAVQVATQVPALAASGDGLAITSATGSYYIPAHRYGVRSVVQNNDTHTTAGLQATVTVTADNDFAQDTTATVDSYPEHSPEWGDPQLSISGSRTFILTYTPTGQLDPGSNRNFSPRVAFAGTMPDQLASHVTITFTATIGGTPTAVSQVVYG